jgi:hypothetical protein
LRHTESIAQRRRDRRKRTALDWMYGKGLLRHNEWLAGKALALLLEWRAASYGAHSSVVTFAQRLALSPPTQIPYEVELPIRGDDNDAMGEGGTVVDVDELRISNRAGNDIFNQTIRDRLNQSICASFELERIDNLLKRALPERPDLPIVIGWAVTERRSVREMPHADVDVLVAALHVIKELWRYDLLEDMIDERTGLRRGASADRHEAGTGCKEEGRGKPIARRVRPRRIPARASGETSPSRFGYCRQRATTYQPI